VLTASLPTVPVFVLIALTTISNSGQD